MNCDGQENGIALPHLLRPPVRLSSTCRGTIKMVFPLPRQPLRNHPIRLLLQHCQFPARNEPAHNQIALCVEKVKLVLCQHSCSHFGSRSLSPLPSLIPARAEDTLHIQENLPCLREKYPTFSGNGRHASGD